MASDGKPACSRVSTLWDDRGEPELCLDVHSVSCTAKLRVDAHGNVRVEVVDGARGFVLPADSLDELHRQSRKRRGYAT